MRLNKRENILVMILITLIVAALPFWFIITPKINELIENQNTLSELKIKREETENTILQVDANMKTIQTLQTEARELYELLGQTKSYDISLILSGMMETHGISPDSLKIAPYQAAALPGDPEPEKPKEDAYGEVDPESAEAVAAAEAAAKAQTEMALMRSAELSFEGEAQENVGAFLDEITNFNKSVLVSGFTISQSNTSKYDVRINFYEFVEPKIQQPIETE